MSKYLSQIKSDAGRRWNRKTGTGFIRPQRKFHKAKMRYYRKIQKALRAQMQAGLAKAGIGPGVTDIGPDKLEVKEIL
jgi:hypothetical protein